MNNNQKISVQAGNNYAQTILLVFLIMFISFNISLSQQSDIALSKKAFSQAEKKGDAFEVVLDVSNSGKSTARKLKILDHIPSNAKFISAFPANLYERKTETWQLDSIAPMQTVRLSLYLRVLDEGVIYQQAELIESQGLDEDSVPQNHDITEDDWAATCLSIPMLYEDKAKIDILATAPNGWLHYQWYRNGVKLSNTQKITISDFGTYFYEVSNDASTCYNGYSCPIVVKYGEPTIAPQPLENAQRELILYPNPSEELLNVTWKENIKFQFANLSIVDMLGRVVFQQSIENQLFQLNVSDWAGGMYKLILQTDSGSFFQENFVVLK